jgi:Na+-driven multidrug efflux pump
LHLRLATPLLLVSACTQPFFASCIILKNSMRGAGASALVMRWSFGSMFFYRVVLLWLIANAGQLSLVLVWIVFGCDVITQAAVFAWLHFRGHWLDAQV